MNSPSGSNRRLVRRAAHRLPHAYAIAPRGDRPLDRRERLGRRPRHHAGSLALILLAGLAILYTCAVARSVLVPLAAALTLHGVFSPLVTLARRRGLPRSLSALGIVLALVVAGGTALYHLTGPASRWLAELPRNSGQLTARLRELRAPVDRVVMATAQVEDLAAAASGSEVRKPDTVKVVQQGPSLFETASDYVSDFGLSIVLALALLFLLLANDGDLQRNLRRSLDRTGSRATLAEAISSFQRDLANYLISVTLINLVLGTCVGLALWALGMPNPLLWGVMAGVLNFVPYLGTTVGVIVVALASLIAFDSALLAALPPLSYLLLSGIEGTIITPWIVGRRLSLNPVAVLMAVIVWGFLWGVPGALLAVPMLMATSLVCRQVRGLGPLGDALSSPPTTVT